MKADQVGLWTEFVVGVVLDDSLNVLSDLVPDGGEHLVDGGGGVEGQRT